MKAIWKSTWQEFLFSLLFFYAGIVVGLGEVNHQMNFGTGVFLLILFHLSGFTIKTIRYWRANVNASQSTTHLENQGQSVSADPGSGQVSQEPGRLG